MDIIIHFAYKTQPFIQQPFYRILRNYKTTNPKKKQKKEKDYIANWLKLVH